MKQRQRSRKTAGGTGATPVRTTFMELIQELATLTKDDNLVVAAVTHIFSRYNVMTTRTLTPVKLVPTLKTVRVRGSGHHSCWA